MCSSDLAGVDGPTSDVHQNERLDGEANGLQLVALTRWLQVATTIRGRGGGLDSRGCLNGVKLRSLKILKQAGKPT